MDFATFVEDYIGEKLPDQLKENYNVYFENVARGNVSFPRGDTKSGLHLFLWFMSCIYRREMKNNGQRS